MFVASRRQTRLTALDLISLCARADNPRRFVRMPEEEASNASESVRCVRGGCGAFATVLTLPPGVAKSTACILTSSH